MIVWASLAALVLVAFGAKAAVKKPAVPQQSPNAAPKPVGPTFNASDPNTFDALFRASGARWGVPWTYLKAFALTEAWNPAYSRWYDSVMRGITHPNDIKGTASSDLKSWGLMQMRDSTARDYDKLASPAALNSPPYAVELAAQHVRFLFKCFPVVHTRYLEWVVKSYNQGHGNTNKEIAGVLKNPAVEEYWQRWQRKLAQAEGRK